jgi:hypothetical protein
MAIDKQLQGNMGKDDSTPAFPDPLSPGRTELYPGDRAGVDEIPEREDEIPKEIEGGAGLTDDERVSREDDNVDEGARVTPGPADKERLPK